ncbi:MAG: tRNA dihydrouridine synthase DusB [Candidatus Omnitrophica bacterium]|nr:tRNA dihydrouridine synthase DusB [Candidatus Omnitrophota bacterium]
MFSIGTLKLKYPIILAPLAGITDLPYRLFNRQFGCELAFTEMINSQSLAYRSNATFKMLEHPKEDSPLGLQLVAKDPDYLERSLDIAASYKFEIIDFNAGCPQKKVTGTGRGAALLQEPQKLCQLLKIITKKAKVPVTAKVRIGWNSSSDHVGIAKAVEDAGCDAVFIHGRTRDQFYGKGVNYDKIREMKEAISIPVIGSGDVLDHDSAKEMLEQAKVDGLLVARGSIGNPWIFKELETLFDKKKKFTRPDPSALIKTMKEHLFIHCQYHGSKRGVLSFRKFFHAYTFGFKDIRKTRRIIDKISSYEKMLEVCDSLEGSEYAIKA